MRFKGRSLLDAAIAKRCCSSGDCCCCCFRGDSASSAGLALFSPIALEAVGDEAGGTGHKFSWCFLRLGTPFPRGTLALRLANPESITCVRALLGTRQSRGRNQGRIRDSREAFWCYRTCILYVLVHSEGVASTDAARAPRSGFVGLEEWKHGSCTRAAVARFTECTCATSYEYLDVVS